MSRKSGSERCTAALRFLIAAESFENGKYAPPPASIATAAMYIGVTDPISAMKAMPIVKPSTPYAVMRTPI